MSSFGLQVFSELVGFVKSAVQPITSLWESRLAKCMQETTRMAIPTSTIKTATKVLIQVIALSSYAGTAHGSSLSKLPVPEVITTATTNTTQGPIVPNDPPDCHVNPLDPNFSDSIGNEPSYCPAGKRKGSNDKPCLGPDSCCLCDPGTYRSQENICDTCIPHTKCKRYKSEGDAFSDSVCLQPVDPPDNEETEFVTDSDGESQTDIPDPQDNVTEPELVDTGQVTKNVMTCGEHSPCLNGGTCVAIVHSWETFCHCPVGWKGVRCEEESLPDKFSIPWLYSLIVILLAALLPLIGWFCGFLCGKTKLGWYTVAQMESDIEMNPVKMRKNGSDDESDRCGLENTATLPG
ncbi:uncharacterized protein [Apostichopus japonicus]|uniref:uncharacterized protein isoform X2 n=1 Tax=Stichopus japonicus TaxID=307972 RepID=UPI003AB3FB24